ncbi:hypothetical protein BGZ46_004789, partial [Entomortierella lignicola]
VSMPNMDGYELLKRLRSTPATMMTPIILLSARAGEEANVEGLDLGADDCLVKPFSARELLARVRSSIRLSDLRHDLIREQRYAFEMKQLIYSISVRIRSGLSLPQILDTASREIFKVIRCSGIRICRFRRVDEETGQHWIKFVTEVVRIGMPKVLSANDHLLPKGLEVVEGSAASSDHDCSSDLRHVEDVEHPIYGIRSFMSVALIHNRKIWGYLLASRDADMVDWSQSEKMLFEQTGNQISLAIAHANLWEQKKSQEVEIEAARAANEAKSQILANTSHELRTIIHTPLTLMLAPLDDVLNATPQDSPSRASLEMVRRNSRRLLKLVNTLLQFSRIEAGKSQALFEETDLSRTTREISANFESVARGFNLEYNIICENLEGLPGGIWVDRSMWSGIILNLIGNAFKHTWSGSITVHQYPILGKNGREGVAVDVKDTGVGIAPEHLHSLFGRFNRIENKQSRSHEGTGIGLSLVKELTEVHGGYVSVTSQLDKGSCFHIWIPAGRSHHAAGQVKSNGKMQETTRNLSRSDDAMNNKTDASMFVEEASQWISNKDLPRSTLSSSDYSTEDEKPGEEDDADLGGEYIRDGQKVIQMNTNFEISQNNMEEGELHKILLSPPETGDLALTTTKTKKRSVQVVPVPRGPIAELSSIAHLEQFNSDKSSISGETLINDEDGGYTSQVHTEEIMHEPEEDFDMLPRTESRRSYIVIVDDNNDMRSYLRDILGKDFRV